MKFKKQEESVVSNEEAVSELIVQLPEIDGALYQDPKEDLTITKLNIKCNFKGEWLLVVDVVEWDDDGNPVECWSAFLSGVSPWDCLVKLETRLEEGEVVLQKNKFMSPKDVQKAMSAATNKRRSFRRKRG